MKISVFVKDFSGGGAERAAILLAAELKEQGHDCELLVFSTQGSNNAHVPEKLNVVNIGHSSILVRFFRLSRYLRSREPDALISYQAIPNVFSAILVKRFPKTIFMSTEHSNMNEIYHVEKHKLATRIAYNIAKYFYPNLHRIICVDKSAAASVEAFTHRIKLPIRILPNPVISKSILVKQIHTNHPWLLDKSVPVFLNVGRLSLQKNQSLLVDAFSIVLRKREARLIILGEGELEHALKKQVKDLGIENFVEMPGYRYPFPYYQACDTFVLCSRWEALPNTIVEALYVGCQVVTTKSSVGTLELVGFGRYGRIVSESTAENLAIEMLASLETKIEKETLQSWAQQFRTDRVAALYLSEIVNAKKEFHNI